MPEKEKPFTPSLSGVKLELNREAGRFVNETVMLERLREIKYRYEGEPLDEDVFFPMLLKYAGEETLISGVPMLIVGEMRQYAADKKENFRALAAGYVPLVIDAMLDDPKARLRARLFLRDALNG